MNTSDRTASKAKIGVFRIAGEATPWWLGRRDAEGGPVTIAQAVEIAACWVDLPSEPATLGRLRVL
jgi:hypothetical protein